MATISLSQDLLSSLGRFQNFRSKRISSFDRTGGNNDRLSISPGETAVLAEISGPAAIHHIWVTINAEPFYGQKLIFRAYWDEESCPSIESPIGDFFGVGHGLNRNLSSLPIANSSEGRARNCYWYMPFKKSAKITVTNEGSRPVGAFYYYIDYRELPSLPDKIPIFHASYRQEMPCSPGKNYLLLEARGRGHYVGSCLSILQRSMGWWGEGDDMIYVDGEEFPSLHGTGSEDYFSDAWGMREGENLFYGCPLQEPDFKTGAKASVYRFHITDPIPFRESIRVTIEHGHANNLADYFSSVAFWYQEEPHLPFLPLPRVSERLPLAMESHFPLPVWTKKKSAGQSCFSEKNQGLEFTAPGLSHSLLSYYDQSGARFPVLQTEGTGEEDTAELSLQAELGEFYNVDLYFLKGPLMGRWAAAEIRNGQDVHPITQPPFQGFSSHREISRHSLRDVRLFPGRNTLVLRSERNSSPSEGRELGLCGLTITPSRRKFIKTWNLMGPFDAPDMSFLQKVYQPEQSLDLKKTFVGKEGRQLAWFLFKTEPSGFARLENLITPPERGIVYGQVFVHSPDDRSYQMLVGSDDGVRIWINDRLVHTNPAYRGAYPDQDRFAVSLKKGRNSLLIKVLQGGGGWGFYIRFVDPEDRLSFSTIPNG